LLSVLLKVGDDISTDDIMPAGARVMPFWSNIPKTSEFTFELIDADYPRRARESRDGNGHMIVAGNNYGQGSSRENAALAPRYLGLRVALARSFARIHWQNLVNFGVLPLTFAELDDYDRLKLGDVIQICGVHATLMSGQNEFTASLVDGKGTIALRHDLSRRQVDLLLSGGVINWLRERLAPDDAPEERGERAPLLNPG
jgi:aconitate hydratase